MSGAKLQCRHLRQSEQTEVRQPRLGRWCVHGGESSVTFRSCFDNRSLVWRLGNEAGSRLGNEAGSRLGNEAGSRLGNVVWEWGWVKAWKWGWINVWECGLGMRLGQDHRWGCTRVCTRLGMFLYTPDRCCGIHVQGAASCSQSLNTSTLHYVVMSGFSVQAIHTLINRLHDDMSFLQQKPWVSASHWCF